MNEDFITPPNHVGFLAKKQKIIHANESFLVKGSVPHTVWDNSDETTIMIGITVKG